MLCVCPGRAGACLRLPSPEAGSSGTAVVAVGQGHTDDPDRLVADRVIRATRADHSGRGHVSSGFDARMFSQVAVDLVLGSAPFFPRFLPACAWKPSRPASLVWGIRRGLGFLSLTWRDSTARLFRSFWTIFVDWLQMNDSCLN